MPRQQNRHRLHSRPRPKPDDFSAELDDLIADDSIRPSLAFLDLPGKEESILDSIENARVELTTGGNLPPVRKSVENARVELTTGGDLPPVSVVPLSDNGDNLHHVAQGMEPYVEEFSDDTDSRKRTFRPRKIGLVQFALTPSERATFDAFWRIWSRQNQNQKATYPTSTTITIGFKRLGSEAGIHFRSCRDAVDGLKAKLIVEVLKEEDSDTRTGRTYRVYSYEETKKRWESAGFTHVLKKSGGGVCFCTPDGKEILSGLKNNGVEVTPCPGGNLHPIGEQLTPRTDGNLPPAPGGNLPPASGCNLYPPSEVLSEAFSDVTPTSSAVDRAKVSRVFAEYVPTIDAAAVDKLIHACQEQAPDASTQEILYFLGMKGNFALAQGERIRNLAGWLIAAVPLCFAGDEFQQWRKDIARQAIERAAEEARKKACAEIERQLQSAPKDNPWVQIATRLKATVNVHTYDTWLRPARFLKLEAGGLVLYFPNKEFTKHVADKFGAQINAVIQELDLPIKTVRFISADELESSLVAESAS